MPSKTVSLHVHKNKIESRRKRQLAKCLQRNVEALVREEDIRAYALVGINSQGKAFAMWDTGAVLPQWAFADTVAGILRKDIEDAAVEEDWRPSLTVHGSD